MAAAAVNRLHGAHIGVFSPFFGDCSSTEDVFKSSENRDDNFDFEWGIVIPTNRAYDPLTVPNAPVIYHKSPYILYGEQDDGRQIHPRKIGMTISE